MSAALAMSQAQMYGGHPWVREIDFLQQARRCVESGTPLEEVVRDELAQRRIYGCGRPINRIDERLPWLTTLAGELGEDRGHRDAVDQHQDFRIGERAAYPADRVQRRVEQPTETADWCRARHECQKPNAPSR